LRVRGQTLTWGERTYVMGIVNVTPDSFSGDGRPEAAAATAHALAQLAAGADLLDIGAESTRPGHAAIDAQTEAQRLLPVVTAVRAQAPDALLSIDTYKPEIFERAHAAGGDMLNSVWGLDAALLASAVACGAAVVIMHNKTVAEYDGGVVDDVLRYLDAQAHAATAAGLAPERVILDPGIGFGKTPEHNLAVLQALPRLVALGFPTLLGVSRKSTIGKLTGRPVGERSHGTAAAIALAVAAGIDIVRVHDVAAQRDAVRVADAIVRGWRPEGWSDTTL
jgi:dihydropteroate synthase